MVGLGVNIMKKKKKKKTKGKKRSVIDRELIGQCREAGDRTAGTSRGLRVTTCGSVHF